MAALRVLRQIRGLQIRGLDGDLVNDFDIGDDCRQPQRFAVVLCK
jgi:hypothetical protein